MAQGVQLQSPHLHLPKNSRFLRFYQNLISVGTYFSSGISASIGLAKPKVHFYPGNTGIMAMEIVTKEDLQVLRMQLIGDIKAILLSQQTQPGKEAIKGYKTKDVRKILGCSVNKLVSLRVARKIRWKKVGGTVYYNPSDIKRLLEEGY